MIAPTFDETPSSSAPDRAAALQIALRELRIELAIITRRVATISALNDADLDVLDLLTLEGPLSPTALARRMGIHAATMTGVLVRLEKSGWVVRRPHSADRRSVEIESTGFERLTEVYRDTNQRLDAIAARLAPDDCSVVLDYLRNVRSTIAEAAAGINPS